MKRTSISYCQVCGTDYTNGEHVFFVPIDNNVICRKCADKISSEKQPRIYKTGEGAPE